MALASFAQKFRLIDVDLKNLCIISKNKNAAFPAPEVKAGAYPVLMRPYTPSAMTTHKWSHLAD